MFNPQSTAPSSLQQQSLMFNTPSSLSTTALPFHPANSMNTPSQNASYPIPHQVRVKKAELPHFSGRRCDWAEFKHIWPKMAVPAFQCKEILANELRIHCHGDAEELLRNVKITGAGTIDVMWKRLLDHYEDTASSMNEILKELDELKMVKSEDYRGLTAYINKVEGCYTQISNLNQLASISMRDVNRMSTLLPATVKELWHQLYHRLPVQDQIHPFGVYAAFLVAKRKDVSHLIEQQTEGESTKKEVSIHHTMSPSGKKESPNKIKPKCAVHKSEGGMHSTENCREFVGMDREEKLNVLREVNACFRCLGYHPRGRCQARISCDKCGKHGHNTLLCLQSANVHTVRNESLDPIPDSTSGCPVVPTSTYNAISNVSSAPVTPHHRARGLYAIVSAPVVGSKECCSVFTDPGSDRSFITNSAAEKFGARKLSKYVLEVTSTGGNEAEYQSDEYELDLITRTGKVVTVRLFGLKRITGELVQLNPLVLKRMFPEYDITMLQRQSKEVDVLLGSDYFGLHPKEELCSVGDNLSLMEGALGVCLQGSHPDLNVDRCVDINMVGAAKLANVKIPTSSNCIVTSVKHPPPSLPFHSLSLPVPKCPPVVHTSAQESSESALPVASKCKPRTTLFCKKANPSSSHRRRSSVGNKVDSVAKQGKVEGLSNGAEHLSSLLMGRSTVKNPGGSQPAGSIIEQTVTRPVQRLVLVSPVE